MKIKNLNMNFFTLILLITLFGLISINIVILIYLYYYTHIDFIYISDLYNTDNTVCNNYSKMYEIKHTSYIHNYNFIGKTVNIRDTNFEFNHITNNTSKILDMVDISKKIHYRRDLELLNLCLDIKNIISK